MKRLYPIGLLHPTTREFIIRWKAKKKYTYSSYIDISDCLEILMGTNVFHKESILSGTYNFTIELKEVQMGWDGEEFIDILVYYIESYVKDRVAKTSTLI